MTSPPGSQLGQYRLTTQLGEGGMGVVYRATDERLGREVAVKVLPDAVAADPERLSRFEREAKLLASLNHPHIATLYGFEVVDKTPFLVMELVEGEDLAARIARGPLPPDETIAIATQVCEALEHAHERGIVHRDLKPANVRLTEDETVKVLDFGLAKVLFDQASGDPELTRSLTPTEGTVAGTLLGTAAYMSPEQARGRRVDQRTDVWALGCLLYEMLTGQQAFAGETVSDAIASILTGEPDWSALPGALPASSQRLLRRCLSKDPRQRLHSVADVRLELTEPLPGEGAPAQAPVRRTRVGWLWGVAGLAIGATVMALWALLGRQAAETEPPRFQQLTYQRGTITGASFTGDGQTVLYSALWGSGSSRVYLRRLDSYEALPVDVGPARVLSVSRQGQVALVVAGAAAERRIVNAGTLAVGSVTGGGMRRLADGVWAADWAPDGVSLATARIQGAGSVLEYPLGTALYESSGQLFYLSVSPDGARVAFADLPLPYDTRGRIAVVDRQGTVSHLTQEYESITGVRWAGDGESVWFTASEAGASEALFQVTMAGEARCHLRAPQRLGLLDVRDDGRLLVAAMDRRLEMVVEDDDGPRDLTVRGRSYVWDISRDGRMLAFIVEGASSVYEAFVRGTDGSPPIRLGDGHAFAISHDGRWVAGSLPKTGSPLELWPVGPGEHRSMDIGLTIHMARWLPDGRRLVVAGSKPGAEPVLWLVDMDGGAPVQISQESVNPGGPGGSLCVSPDGTQVAALGADRRLRLYPVSGGPGRDVPEARLSESPIAWGDGNTLFLAAATVPPARIVRLDLTAGERQLWKEIDAADRAGVGVIAGLQVTPDGNTVAYSVFRELSSLYVIEGLQ